MTFPTRGKVLLVDDDSHDLLLAEDTLREADYEIARARGGAEAVAQLELMDPDVIVMDLELPDGSGYELLARLRDERPGTPVVVMPADGDSQAVARSRALGAVDYVHKPCDPLSLVTSVVNASARAELASRVDGLREELRRQSGLSVILGSSEGIRRTRALLARAAANQVPVLLLGESGSGKEIAARAVHAESARADGPFVVVNCGAVPERSLEAELFGQAVGALPGATAARVGGGGPLNPGQGCFELASGGTLLLDEIDCLPPELQLRVLRVLETGTLQRVGGSKEIAVDVRLVAASEKDLRGGGLRKDLYYKLAVFPVTVPPLRDRGGDVLLLADAFLQRFAKRHGRRITGLAREARAVLLRHRWTGNVRELENAIERAVLLEEGMTLSRGSLPAELLSGEGSERSVPAAVRHLDPDAPTAEVRLSHVPAAGGPSARPPTEAEILPFAEEERRIVQRALLATGWNIARAAKALRIGRARLYRKIDAYDLRKRPKTLAADATR